MKVLYLNHFAGYYYYWLVSNLFFAISDNKPSGAILSLGKYERDYDWSQTEGVTDGMEDASHFQKLHSLKASRKGK